MTHGLAASPCNILHISDVQAAIIEMTRKKWSQRHSVKTLPRMHKAGPVDSTSQLQSGSAPVYPLSEKFPSDTEKTAKEGASNKNPKVWQSRGTNVYFEPTRVLRTSFHSSTGKHTPATTKLKSGRVPIVNVWASLNSEKYPNRLPELQRNSTHGNPRPLGSVTYIPGGTYFSSDKPTRDHPHLLSYGHVHGSIQSTGHSLHTILPDLLLQGTFSTVTARSKKT